MRWRLTCARPARRCACGASKPRQSSVALFLFYWVQFAIVTFFNTALLEVATLRFDGENASVRDGLRRSWSRLPTILVYSAFDRRDGENASVRDGLRRAWSRLPTILVYSAFDRSTSWEPRRRARVVKNQ